MAVYYATKAFVLSFTEAIAKRTETLRRYCYSIVSLSHKKRISKKRAHMENSKLIEGKNNGR